jgi:hypothetical protein
MLELRIPKKKLATKLAIFLTMWPRTFKSSPILQETSQPTLPPPENILYSGTSDHVLLDKHPRVSPPGTFVCLFLTARPFVHHDTVQGTAVALVSKASRPPALHPYIPGAELHHSMMTYILPSNEVIIRVNRKSQGLRNTLAS